jgi:hypothetical protein
MYLNEFICQCEIIYSKNVQKLRNIEFPVTYRKESLYSFYVFIADILQF